VIELTDASLDEFFKVSRDLYLVGTIIISSSILIVGHRFECIELLRLTPPGDSMDMGKGYDDMIGCATCSLSQRLM